MRSATLFLLTILPLGSNALLRAQTPQWTTASCASGQGEMHGSWLRHWNDGRTCQLRHTELASTGLLKVEADNGNITVIGEDRKNIAIEARIVVDTSNEKDAAALLNRITIDTDGTIRARGPHFSGWLSHGGYSVDYDLRVPVAMAATVETANGRVLVKNLQGTIRAASTNGSIALTDVSGDVHASTVNGGISIHLDGKTWNGAGLKAETVNGGIKVSMPGGYSAHLKASTVNGGISVDFPVTVQGRIGHNLDANIGAGGALIKMHTVNGGIQFERSE